MYKLFLCLRYLRKRRIAFFAIAAVTLSTAMLVIVISVMGGFLDMVRERSRGLFGDLVLETRTIQGFPFYDEFIAELKREYPDLVREATPVIYSYGLLKFPSDQVTAPVRIVGIRLEEFIRTNDFYRSLYYEHFYPGTTHLGEQKQPVFGFDDQWRPILPPDLEAALRRARESGTVEPEKIDIPRTPRMRFPGPGRYGSPAFDAAVRLQDMPQRLREFSAAVLDDARRIAAAVRADGRSPAGALPATDTTPSTPASSEAPPPENPPAAGPPGEYSPATCPAGAADPRSPALKREYLDIHRTGRFVVFLLTQLDLAPETRDALRAFEPAWTHVEQAWLAGDPEALAAHLDVASRALQLADLIAREHLREPGYVGPALPGVIIGRDLIGYPHESGTEYDRFYDRGERVILTFVPLTASGTFSAQNAIARPMRYVDDSRYGVYEIDSKSVYLDFDIAQELVGMGPQRLADELGGGTTPPRASQIQIKLAGGVSVPDARRRVEALWKRFVAGIELSPPPGTTPEDLQFLRLTEVKTWDELQRQFIAALEKEKVLVTILFGVMSLVSVFIVWCIFYMIVQEKTREIGLVRSLGASAPGTAGIFVFYGAGVGMVGAVLGLLIGVPFVWHINEIQEWLVRINPEFRVWSRETYTFDFIPNVVKAHEAAAIAVAAIVSSVFGSLAAAVRAARIWPAEALRYE